MSRCPQENTLWYGMDITIKLLQLWERCRQRGERREREERMGGVRASNSERERERDAIDNLVGPQRQGTEGC